MVIGHRLWVHRGVLDTGAGRVSFAAPQERRQVRHVALRRPVRVLGYCIRRCAVPRDSSSRAGQLARVYVLTCAGLAAPGVHFVRG